MDIHKNFSLKNYNTFGIDAKAKQFVEVSSIEELKTILSQEKNIFVLGGGSNMLLTQDIDKLVVFVNTKGIKTSNKKDNTIEVTAQAGENWHEFVLWCIDHDYGGIENLSLIPGNVGTCPIQNIGAYGVEIKDTFKKLTAIDIDTLEEKIFTLEDCLFGYRNSIFKNELKGKYIITSVTFELTTENHQTDISYGAIVSALNGNENPTLKEISNAVISIRESKLPNPKEIGNSGSFFKNPVIDITLFEKLKKQYPNIPSYLISETSIKVPAGWLIEQAGFKGKRFGDAGVHDKQALVLVNHGNAKGFEVYQIAKKIQEEIKSKFEISLEIEVNVI